MKELSIPVFIIKEGEKYSAYSPALDLATCGDSFEHAQKMFDEAAQLFIDECIERGTLNDVLRDFGWQEADHPKRFVPPEVVASTSHSIHIPAPA